MPVPATTGRNSLKNIVIVDWFITFWNQAIAHESVNIYFQWGQCTCQWTMIYGSSD